MQRRANLDEETKEGILRNVTEAFPHVTDTSFFRMVFDSQNWDLDRSLIALKTFLDKSKHKPKADGAKHAHPQHKWQKNKVEKPGPYRTRTFSQKPSSSKSHVGTAAFRAKLAASGDAAKAQGAASKIAKRETLVRTYKEAIMMKNQTQRITSLVVNGIRTVVVVRGCPGSGKSTLIASLSAHLSRELAKARGEPLPTTSLDHHTFEADDFWVHPTTGKYMFNADYIEYAHLWNQKLVRQACAEGRSPLFIGNTHSRMWEMKVVVSAAIEFGYTVEIVDPVVKWAFDVKELTRRNVHGVHAEPIQRMVDRYEHGIKPAHIMTKFNLSYAPNAHPPQRCLVTFDSLPSKTQAKIFNSRFYEVPLVTILAMKSSVDGAQATESAYKNNQSAYKTPQRSVQDQFRGIPNPLRPAGQQNINDQQQSAYWSLLSSLGKAEVDSEGKPVTRTDETYSSQMNYKKTEDNNEQNELIVDSTSASWRESLNEILENAQSEAASNDYPLISFDHDDDDVAELLDYLQNSEETADFEVVQPDGSVLDRQSIELGHEALPSLSSKQGWAENFHHWIDGGLSLNEGFGSTVRSGSGSAPSKAGSCTSRGQTFEPTREASCNTHSADFQALNRVNVGGSEPTMKILSVGHFESGTATISWDRIKTVATHEKSTTTHEPASVVSRNSGLEILGKMFPTVSTDCLTELFDKCDRDLDWTVNLVLDSGHEIEHNFVADQVADTIDDTVDLPLETLVVPDEPTPTVQKPKKLKSQLSDAYTELLKEFEGSFVLSENSYSDQMKKVRETKFGLKPVDATSSPESEEPPLADENDNDEEEMSLLLPKSVVTQLQDKFCPMPNMFGEELVVKLPVGLARQIYSYALDSICQEMEQQNTIDFNVKGDEQLARQLQQEMEELESPASLQEIMNYEMLLRKREKESGKTGANADTFASKLSHQLLTRRFPNINPETLKIVLFDTNHSLHEATNLLSCAGHVPAPDPEEPKTAVLEETEYRMTRKECIQQANAYHDVSTKLNEMRKHYHTKARESFNSGNYAVAMFYKELFDWYSGRIKESNSKAAQVMLFGNEGAQTVDLHFLSVSESVKILDLFLDESIRQLSGRKLDVYIITGRGLHSSDGKSKIKPAVQERLKRRGLSYSEVNPGMLKTSITKSCLVSYQLEKV